MKRKVIGLGKYSAVISLPRELLKQFGWRVGQMLDLSAKGKTIHIRDFKNRKKQKEVV